MSGKHQTPARVPTQLAALAAGVTEATIRKWASRGKLTRYGTTQRAEYDLGELAELAAQRTGAEPESDARSHYGS